MKLRSSVLLPVLVLLSGAIGAPGAAADVYWASHDSGSIGYAGPDRTVFSGSLVSGASGPTGVAVDGSYVYWSNTGTGSIGRAELDGGGPQPEFVQGAFQPAAGTPDPAVAVNGSHIYWSDIATDELRRSDLDGANSETFATSAGTPRGIALDATYLYWTSANGAIGRKPLAGGAAEQSYIAIPNAGPRGGLAVDDTYIYWGDGAGRVGRARLDQASPPQYDFIPAASAVWGVAVDATHVYWTRYAGNVIGRANIDGTSPTEPFVFAFRPIGIAVSTPYVTPTPASKDFGGHGVAEGESLRQRFIFKNTSADTVTMAATSLAGNDVSQFTIKRDQCVGVTLLPGQNCRVAAAFNPSSTGVKRARLEAHPSLGSPFRATLTGTGTQPVLRISPRSFDYGTLAVAGGSLLHKFAVLNASDVEAATVTSVTIAGPDADQFTASHNTCSAGMTLPVGGFGCRVRVTFDPTSAGPKTATIVVDSSDGPDVTSTLTGQGG